MRYFSILSLFTSTNFLYVCRWLPSGNYSNQLSNEKSFIRPFLFYYHHHYYYYYYSINLEKKERKTESKISGPSFVGENYDKSSTYANMLRMNELGNSAPFVLSCFLFASGGKGKKVILNI